MYESFNWSARTKSIRVNEKRPTHTYKSGCARFWFHGWMVCSFINKTVNLSGARGRGGYDSLSTAARRWTGENKLYCHGTEGWVLLVYFATIFPPSITSRVHCLTASIEFVLVVAMVTDLYGPVIGPGCKSIIQQRCSYISLSTTNTSKSIVLSRKHISFKLVFHYKYFAFNTH